MTKITIANLSISRIIIIALSKNNVIVEMISFNLYFLLVICILSVIVKVVNVVGCVKVLCKN